MYNDRYDRQRLQTAERHQTQGFPTRIFNSTSKCGYPSQGYTGIPFPQCPIPLPHFHPCPIPPPHTAFCGGLPPRAPNVIYAPYPPIDLRYKPFADPMTQYMGIKTSVLQRNGFSYYEQSLLRRDTTQLQNGTHFISRSIAGAHINKNEQQQQLQQISCTCPPLVDKYEKKNATEIIPPLEPADERDFTRYDLINAIDQIKPFQSIRKRKLTDFSISNILYNTKAPYLAEQTYQSSYDYSNEQHKDIGRTGVRREASGHLCNTCNKSLQEGLDTPICSPRPSGSNSNFDESIANRSMNKRIKLSFGISLRKGAERNAASP